MTQRQRRNAPRLRVSSLKHLPKTSTKKRLTSHALYQSSLRKIRSCMKTTLTELEARSSGILLSMRGNLRKKRKKEKVKLTVRKTETKMRTKMQTMKLREK